MQSKCWIWSVLPWLVACGGAEFVDGQANSLDASVEVDDVEPDDDDDDVGGSRPTDGGLPQPVLEASVIGGVSILPPRGLVTSEDGDQASFEVVLINEPSSAVTIGLSSSDENEGLVSLPEVVFDLDNWDQPQTVVVTGQDDDDVDGNRAYTIATVPAVSDDAQYDGVDPADVEVTNRDNDAVGIQFAPEEGLVTSESGDQANFTVRLSSKPTGDVAVFLASSDTSEGVVSPRVITFTEENWNSPTMVTATGQDDDDADGAQDYQVIVENIISADANYSALDFEALGVNLRNTDDDSAGVTVTGEDLITSERGESATFAVALNREPQDDVVIRVSSSDEGEGVAAPSLLTFTVDNWNAPQEVTVTGVDDGETDGDQEYVVELDRALSVDPAYNGIDVPDVTVMNIDDESAGFTIMPREIVVSEDGSSAEFAIRPNTQPTADVIVGLSVNDESEGMLSTDQLTFTPDDWQTPQSVEVTGVDDDETDGNQVFIVLTAPAQSEDDGYRGLNPSDVNVLNMDNDTAGISVMPLMGLETNETGTTAEFMVTLLTAPSGSVRITLVSDDDTEGDVMPTAIDFDTDDWNEPVTVTVSGVDDPITDGAQPFTVITELETDDENYAELVVPDVMVVNRDDECPTPAIIDDMEDDNLMICPSEGRSGTWSAENALAGSIELAIQNADRDGSDSDFALLASGEPNLAGELPDGEALASYPVLATSFRANVENGAQAYDASAFSGFRFMARSSPGGKLRVALVTSDTVADDGVSTGGACFGGCSGHFETDVDVTQEWTLFEVPFEALQSGNRSEGLDPSALVGMKFALQVSQNYELWLDDVQFVP